MAEWTRLVFDLTAEELERFPDFHRYLAFAHFLEPARYRNLFKLILLNNCYRILEIGTWKGEQAERMMTVACHVARFPEYYGFDLFEEIDRETQLREFSKQEVYPVKDVFNRLKNNEVVGRTTFKLYKGNTRSTLPQYLPEIGPLDFVFIDGGHSVETVWSDWLNVSKVMMDYTIVVFDDYYLSDMPQEIGCNLIIDSLDRDKYDVEFLEPVDHFEHDWGSLDIQMVKVCKQMN